MPLASPLCANIQVVSLHAGLRCGGDVRRSLGQLCRDINRSALANEPLQCKAADPMVPKLEAAPKRRRHAPGDVCAGVHAEPGSTGAIVRFAAAFSYHWMSLMGRKQVQPAPS